MTSRHSSHNHRTDRLWRVWAFGTLMSAVSSLAAAQANAQLRVDISGVGATQYPIAIADFAGDAKGQAIAEVIRADLTRSGQFRLINATGANLSAESPIAYDDWRSRGADYLAYGSITQSGGQYNDQLPPGRLGPQDAARRR